MGRPTRWLEGILVVTFLVLTLDVLWGVFSRYVIGEQSRWTEELAIYLLIWIALLGAPVAYAEKSHLGVDYLVEQLDLDAKWVAKLCVEVLVAGFAGFVLIYGGLLLVSETLAAGQVSPALGIPTGYVYLATPTSGVFFVLVAVGNLVRLMRGNRDEPSPPPSE